MDSMQADALRRVQEMQSNAGSRNNANSNRRSELRPSEHQNQTGRSEHRPSEHQNQPGRSEHRPSEPQNQARMTEQCSCEETANQNGDISLFADKEKLLILALILILGGEDNCDPTLTLALLYLII